MLVSYDLVLLSLLIWSMIAGSPECWWVTTISGQALNACFHCRVTRMLVSYDSTFSIDTLKYTLQGHQNVGELRHWSWTYCLFSLVLQGHQNVGELRHLSEFFMVKPLKLQGHQNVGELRPPFEYDLVNFIRLQGHQNVGELRRWVVLHLPLGHVLQGHQNVGELRLCLTIT